MKPLLILSFIFSLSIITFASPLNPVKTDHPRDTMKTFMTAMNDYAKGIRTKNKELQNRLGDAVRTLDTSAIPFVVRNEKSKEAAILLKEVIDRVILIDYSKVPEDPKLKRWRLKDTEIEIRQMKEGPRSGEFLFSQATVHRVKNFYKTVQNLPYIEKSGKGALYKVPWQDKLVPGWGKDKILGFEKWQLLGLLVVIVFGLIFKLIIEKLVGFINGFLKSSDEEKIKFLTVRALERPAGLLGASVAWLTGVYILKFDGIFQTVLLSITQIFLGISVIWATYNLSGVLTAYLSRMAEKTESDLDDQLVPLISKSLRIFIVVLGFLVVAQNLGINVMSLVAGLGLGGLAFALAAKDTAANLFGSIMILFDRPFRVGDWIVTDTGEGTIEEVGFRSTRIRTFYKSQVTIPNAVLANATIDNMGRRNHRRIKTMIGVTYGTSPENLEKFIEGIKQVILNNEYTWKDYFHVVLNNYGAYSLDILVYFFVDVPDWSEELKQKQVVFLEIYKLADKLGVDFAFPTQSVHVESFPSSNSLPQT